MPTSHPSDLGNGLKGDASLSSRFQVFVYSIGNRLMEKLPWLVGHRLGGHDDRHTPIAPLTPPNALPKF